MERNNNKPAGRPSQAHMSRARETHHSTRPAHTLTSTRQPPDTAIAEQTGHSDPGPRGRMSRGVSADIPTIPAPDHTLSTACRHLKVDTRDMHTTSKLVPPGATLSFLREGPQHTLVPLAGSTRCYPLVGSEGGTTPHRGVLGLTMRVSTNIIPSVVIAQNGGLYPVRRGWMGNTGCKACHLRVAMPECPSAGGEVVSTGRLTGWEGGIRGWMCFSLLLLMHGEPRLGTSHARDVLFSSVRVTCPGTCIFSISEWVFACTISGYRWRVWVGRFRNATDCVRSFELQNHPSMRCP